MRVQQKHLQMVQFWAARHGIADVKKLTYAQELEAAKGTQLPKELIAALKDGRTEFEALDTRAAEQQLALQGGNVRFTPITASGSLFETSMSRGELDTMIATLSEKGLTASEKQMLGEAFSMLTAKDQSATLDALFASGSSSVFNAVAPLRKPEARLSPEAYAKRVAYDETPRILHGLATDQLAGYVANDGIHGENLGTLRTGPFSPEPQRLAKDPEAYRLADELLAKP